MFLGWKKEIILYWAWMVRIWWWEYDEGMMWAGAGDYQWSESRWWWWGVVTLILHQHHINNNAGTLPHNYNLIQDQISISAEDNTQHWEHPEHTDCSESWFSYEKVLVLRAQRGADGWMFPELADGVEGDTWHDVAEHVTLLHVLWSSRARGELIRSTQNWTKQFKHTFQGLRFRLYEFVCLWVFGFILRQNLLKWLM